ncbi:thiamine-monophosphate kinase [Nitratiruptor sp. YY08-26]|uniref:thiamine-phosphate kinase n=1 Tax=unclassified Nitratiruptor TaxID=2624044 RepID=UPI001916BE70|nr:MULTISPECIES: thiamine-phosphate kinase [unclassified Nitratiruptor]BCD62489.1 thiamine-monophosphate kinase [Nitratiruptor sp. YY08-13]BCD66425.1 thiamine-monophosphate kinase [Nitratiruptor sp. YY08-26]
MQKEFYYISLFNSKFIGDDGAYIDGMVYSADAFCEDIHFKKEWMSLEQIARKAMLVNISDVIAMNAKPQFALITIKIPKNFTNKMLHQIQEGLAKTAQEYGIEIIGGDTVAGKKLDIAITLVSVTKKPIFRKPLRQEYLLAYTGTLGSVKKDLTRLLRGGKVSKKSKFIAPQLRKDFMHRASRFIQACMDISDGLFDDLEKMTRLNKVGIKFLRKISKRVGCSGEEYELLFAFEPKDYKAIVRRANQARTKVTVFGKVTRRSYRNICKPNHF